MPTANSRSLDPLADTQHEVDTRDATRFGCQKRHWLQIIVRPSFICCNVRVRDISANGVGFFCHQAIEPGTSIAILWDYGPMQGRCILRARVARLGPGRDGGWLIGCAFNDRLQPAALNAFLRYERNACEAD
jgi:hypothetical protein